LQSAKDEKVSPLPTPGTVTGTDAFKEGKSMMPLAEDNLLTSAVGMNARYNFSYSVTVEHNSDQSFLDSIDCSLLIPLPVALWQGTAPSHT